jgi:hypothetical protein
MDTVCTAVFAEHGSASSAFFAWLAARRSRPERLAGPQRVDIVGVRWKTCAACSTW